MTRIKCLSKRLASENGFQSSINTREKVLSTKKQGKVKRNMSKNYSPWAVEESFRNLKEKGHRKVSKGEIVEKKYPPSPQRPRAGLGTRRQNRTA
jgi:hypothetical protein